MKMKMKVMAFMVGLLACLPVASAWADNVVLPEGQTVEGWSDEKPVKYGDTFYETLKDAVHAAFKAGDTAIVIYCKPGADVGTMTHTHVVNDLTVYGNGAYVSGGEHDFEVDTYTGIAGPAGSALTGDITLNIDHLNGCAVWGQRNSDYKVTINLTGCQNVNRIYFSTAKGTIDINVDGCSFVKENGSSANTSIKTDSQGTWKITNTTFNDIAVAIAATNENGPADVTVENCTFIDCATKANAAANSASDYASPIRVLGRSETTLKVDSCSFSYSEGAEKNFSDIVIGEIRANKAASGKVSYEIVNTVGEIDVIEPHAANVTIADFSKKITVTEATKSTPVKGDNEAKAPAVAKIGDVGYETLAEAIAAAETGDKVEIVKSDTYSFPNLPKNITLSCCDGVVFNCEGSGSISSVPNGCTVIGGTFNMGQNNYHGWQHAGAMAFENSTFNGKFFGYANLTFTGCHFVQTTKDYCMWTYSSPRIDYINCTFDCVGKAVNVYWEQHVGPTEVTADGCTFNSSEENKPALKINSQWGAFVVATTANNTLSGFPRGISGYDDEPNEGDYAYIVTNAEFDEAGKLIGGDANRAFPESIVGQYFAADLDTVSKDNEGNWKIGVKTEDDTIITTKPQESKVEVPQDVEIGAEVAEKIQQSTKVEGVKLSASADEGKTSGIVAVVEEAKKNTEFAAAVAAAAEVSVKVEVKVEPKAYDATADKGKVAFKLTPKATVTVVQEEKKLEQVVPVTNDMIDQSEKIAVSIYTGFKPATILHNDDDGALIEAFSGDGILYNEKTGVATVEISHFSTLLASQQEIDTERELLPADVRDTAVKVVDGFYQSATSYAASTDFYITSKAGLEYLRDFVNRDRTDYSDGQYFDYSNKAFGGKTVHLLTDIDLNNEPWVSIGWDSDKPFCGSFNGENHTISNMKIVNETITKSKGFYAGLFGYLAWDNTTFQNLTFNNVTVKNVSDYAGALCGRHMKVTGAIKNIKVTGTVDISATSFVGGIAGHDAAQTSDCSVNAAGQINATTAGWCGGIAGYVAENSATTIEKCSVKGGVSLKGENIAVGGITGHVGGSNVIKDCMVDVSVIGGGAGKTGAIAGKMEGTPAAEIVNNDSTKVVDGDGAAIEKQLGGAYASAATCIVGTGVTYDENGKINGGTFESLPETIELAEGFEPKTDPTTGKIVVEEKVVAVAKVIDAEGNETTYPTLAAAFAAVTGGETVTLLANCALDANTSIPGKDVTITAVDPSISLTLKTGGYGGSGANVTFKNMKLIGVAQNSITQYTTGLIGVKKETYENCTMIGPFCTYGAASFTGCVFKSVDFEGDENNLSEMPAPSPYTKMQSLWVYVGDCLVTVDHCKFLTYDRAVKVFGDESKTFNVRFTNTDFYCQKKNKAAIMVGVDHLKETNIIIDEKTVIAHPQYSDGVEGGYALVYSEYGELNGGTSEAAYLAAHPEASVRGQYAVGENIVLDESGKVTAGTFSKLVGEKIIAEGFEGKADPTTGKIVIEEKAAVCKIVETDVTYPTLQEAFAAAGEKKNVTIELLSDVDLKDVDWPSIHFNGTFDGKGYTISNLRVDYEQEHSGFIRYSDSGAVVKNVTFKDASITGDRASVVIGYGYGCTANNVVIDGGTITGIQKCGGIVAYVGEGAPLTINGCTVKNLALVYADFEKEGNGGETFGGLVGYVHYGVNAVITGNKVSGITFKGALDEAKFNERYGKEECYEKYYQLICHTFIGAVLGVTKDKEVSVTLADNEVEPVDGLFTCPTTTDFMGFYYREGWTSMSVVDVSIDGVLVPNRAVAEIGETKYYTLAEAVAAVEDGQTIKLLTDMSEICKLGMASKTTNPTITFDLNGHTIYNKVQYGSGPSGAKATFIIKNGTIDVRGENLDTCAIHASGSEQTCKSLFILEDLTIYGYCKGQYAITGQIDAAYGDVRILSGTYIIDENAENGISGWATYYGGSVQIMGGTFSPTYNVEDYLAPGCYIEEDADGNQIVRVDNSVAEIEGGAKFDSLEEAMLAAQDGDTVNLLKDLNERLDVVFETNTGAITLNLNGHVIAGGVNLNAYEKPYDLHLTIKGGTLGSADGMSSALYATKITGVRLEEISAYGSVAGQTSCPIVILSGSYHANAAGSPVDNLANNSLTFYGGTYDYDPMQDAMWVNNALAPFHVCSKVEGKWIVGEAQYDPLTPDGDGVYHIATVEELISFREMVNSGVEDFADKVVKLDADLDLSAILDWTRIGSTANPFRGSFDGQNHKISNLTIVNNNDPNGFFGYVTAERPETIKDLTFENVSISAVGNVGTLAGHIYTGYTVSNVNVTGTIQITGSWYLGGIQGGMTYSKYVDCHVDGIDKANSFIRSINGPGESAHVGGILGHCGEDAVVVDGCTVENITFYVDGAGVGGIIGLLQYGTDVRDCAVENIDIVSGSKENLNTVGYIAGRNVTEADSKVSTVINSTATDVSAELAEEDYDPPVVGREGDTNRTIIGTDVEFDENGKVVSGEFELIGKAVMTDITVSDTAVISDPDPETGKVVVKKAVCKIVGTGVTYPTLEEAAEDSVIGDTIKLLDDVDLTNYDKNSFNSIVIEGVTLDLDGHTITSNNGGVVYDGDNAVIRNGSFVVANGGSYALFVGNGQYEDRIAEGIILEDLTCSGGINVFAAEVTICGGTVNDTNVTGTNYYAVWGDEGSDVTVESGFFSTSRDDRAVLLACDTGSVKARGGYYNREVIPECVADGYECVANTDPATCGDYPWMVRADPNVAAVISADGTTTNKFETFKAAVTASKDGETVLVLADTAIGQYVSIEGKCITIDLNGKTLTKEDYGQYSIWVGAAVTVKDSSAAQTGKIDLKQLYAKDGKGYLNYGIIVNTSGRLMLESGKICGQYAQFPIYMQGGELVVNGGAIVGEYSGCYALACSKGAKVEINGGLVQGPSSGAGATAIYCYVGAGAHVTVNGGQVKGYNYGIGAFDDNHVTVAGGEVTAEGFAIANNGSDTTDSYFTISGGVVNGGQMGIYHPGPGICTISGGKLIGGYTGIEMRAGTLNVTGGEITGNGSPADVEANDNGPTTVGAAVAVAQHTTMLPVSVNISGGQLNALYPLYESNPGKNPADVLAKVRIVVTGGQFKNLYEGTTPIYSEDCSAFASGGVYSGVVDQKYIAEGLFCLDNDDQTTYAAGYLYKIGLKPFEKKDGDTGAIEATAKDASGETGKIALNVSDEWVKEQFAEYHGTEATKPTAAEISAKLDEKDENGLAKWQNFVLGVEDVTKSNPLSPDGGNPEDKENVVVKTFLPVNLPKLDTGVTVEFVLLKGAPTRDAAGEITSWSWIEVQTLDKPEFPVEVAGLDSETYWRIKTRIRAHKTTVVEASEQK